MLEPLAALTGQLAGKFQGLAKQPVQAPEAKKAEQPAEPVVKPAETKPLPAAPKVEPAPAVTAKAEQPADTKPAPKTVVALNKPAVSEPLATKPLPVAPKTAPAPANVAKAVVPAETKPALEQVAALNKPAASEPEKAKPLPVAPKAETAPVVAAKSVTPEPAKAEPEAAVALNTPAETDSSVKLIPSQADEKPSPAIALTPSLPKPATPDPANVANAPVIASKTGETPASPVPLAQVAAKVAEPAKPAAVAVAVTPQKQQPVSSENAKAGDTGAQSKEPQAAGGLLTSTAQTPPAALVVPAPVAPEKQAPAKEQLLAMADPVPATKLAPAATEAAATPAPSTEPEAGKFGIPLPGDETDEDKKQLAIKAQKELTRLGCFRNETDGDWGPRSARALLRFYAEQKLEPDQLEPTAELVSRLSSIDKVVCKNTETDRPKQAVKKAPAKATAKTQPAPAKQKAPAVQKAQPKPKPAYKAPPAVAKAPPPPAAPKKKISGGALIGAFR